MTDRGSNPSWGGRLSRLGLLALGFVITFPPLFRLPAAGPGVDESWVYSLNWSAAHGQVWGRDAGFSYGPLGFTLLPLDLGSNLAWAAAARLTLHVLWWLSIALLLLRPTVALATFVLLLGASILPGLYLGLEVPRYERVGVLIVTTVNFLALSLLDRRDGFAVPALAVAAYALLAKFNIGVACAGAVVGWMAGRLATERTWVVLARITAFGCAGLALLVALFATRGGTWSDLSAFVRDSILISEGYSSNLSVRGHKVPVVLAVVGLIALMLYLAIALTRRRSLAPFLLTLLPVAFILYKSVVVRNDPYHWWPMFLTAQPLLGLLLLWRLHPRESAAVRFVLTAGVLAVLVVRISPADTVGRAVASGPHFLKQALTWNSTRERLRLARADLTSVATRDFPPYYHARPVTATDGLLERLDLTLYTVRGTLWEVPDPPVSPPHLDRSIPTDVFPNETVLTELYGLPYRPRFSYQAYAAYHPAIDRRAAENFRSADSAGQVLYRHEAEYVEHEHPFLASPVCALELLRWFRYHEDIDSKTLLLRRRAKAGLGPVRPLESRMVRSGDIIEWPANPGGLTLLEADFALTVRGRLQSFTYKVLRPTAEVVYTDGTRAVSQIAWQNATSGLIVSDLPRSLAEARELFRGRPAGQVRSVRLIVNDAFRDMIPIRITKVDRLPNDE